MVIKKKKIGLIIGSGELATYCMEQLLLLGYETTIVRLPCSKVKIRKNLDRIDLEYEKINETFSFLKQRQIHDIALIGYMERPEIDFSRVNYGSQILLSTVFPIALPAPTVITGEDKLTISLTLILVVVIPLMIMSYSASITPLLVPIFVKFLLFPV